MAWTAPSTVTTNQIVTAALWNQQVRDNLLFLSTHAHSGAAGDGNDEMTGLDFLNFDDLVASPATAGRLQRNGANLEYYNGSAVVKVTEADAASGASPRTLGTGAAQAAAGDHGHTFAALNGGGTYLGTNLGANFAKFKNEDANNDEATVTINPTESSLMVGVALGIMDTKADAATYTLRLLLDGVEITSVTLGNNDIQRLRGTRAVSSGARIALSRITKSSGTAADIFLLTVDAFTVNI